MEIAGRQCRVFGVEFRRVSRTVSRFLLRRHEFFSQFGFINHFYERCLFYRRLVVVYAFRQTLISFSPDGSCWIAFFIMSLPYGYSIMNEIELRSRNIIGGILSWISQETIYYQLIVYIHTHIYNNDVRARYLNHILLACTASKIWLNLFSDFDIFLQIVLRLQRSIRCFRNDHIHLTEDIPFRNFLVTRLWSAKRA